MADSSDRILGPEPREADSVLILLHGRGASARGLQPLAAAVAPAGTSVLAPQADGNTWYPNRFLFPRTTNEPWLSNALARVEALVRRVEQAGIPRDRVVVAGFSQGACLAVEHVARHPARYAGCVAMAGALIGPDPLADDYAGDLAGTPVHLAVGDRDEHVPPRFVEDSAEVLERMGARVTVRIHRGMGHDIHPDEVQALAALLRKAGGPGVGA